MNITHASAIICAGCVLCGLQSVPTLQASGAQHAGRAPAVITVDDDQPADFTTIQDAIDHAQDGDTIKIRPGTYAGAYVAGKHLDIVGSGKRTLVNVPCGAACLPADGAGVAIVIDGSDQKADGTSIRDLAIDLTPFSTDDPDVFPGGVLLLSVSRCSVSGLEIRNVPGPGFGIEVAASSYNEITHNEIAGFSGELPYAIFLPSMRSPQGPYLFSTNNLVAFNTIQSLPGDTATSVLGIGLHRVNDNKIVHNKIMIDTGTPPAFPPFPTNYAITLWHSHRNAVGFNDVRESLNQIVDYVGADPGNPCDDSDPANACDNMIDRNLGANRRSTSEDFEPSALFNPKLPR